MNKMDSYISAYIDQVGIMLTHYHQYIDWYQGHPGCHGWGQQEFISLKIGSLDIENKIAYLKTLSNKTQDELLVEDVVDATSKLETLKAYIDEILTENKEMVDMVEVQKQRNALRNFNSLVTMAAKRLQYQPTKFRVTCDYKTLQQKYDDINNGYIPSHINYNYYETVGLLENYILGE